LDTVSAESCLGTIDAARFSTAGPSHWPNAIPAVGGGLDEVEVVGDLDERPRVAGKLFSTTVRRVG
jgi:hypothetical protein